MPTLDGIQTVKIIKEKSNSLPKSIIMLSSFRLETISKLSSDVGINTFLQKPINPSIFNDILSSLFSDDYVSQYENNTNNKFQTLKENVKKIEYFNILLTEDNVINQEIIVGILEETNITIDIASNGKEAVEILKENKKEYSMVLMDLQMPIMDGYKATKIIRKFNKDVPIIALTANAMKEDIQNTKKIGMNDHLSKPIDIELFLNLILTYSNKDKKTNNVLNFDFNYIDVNVGLEYLAFDKNLYIRILNKFYIEYNDVKLEGLDDENLQILAHTVKGLSANIGAKRLNEISKELEQSLDKNLFSKFYMELKNVMDELRAYVNKNEKELQ